MRKAPALVALLVIALLGLAACGGDDDGGDGGAATDTAQGQDQEFEGTVKIGLLTPVSGPGSTYFPAIEQTATLAVDEINAEGGVNGNELELIVADTETNPAAASREARRLAQEDVKFVVGATVAPDRDAALEALEGSGIPFTFAWDNEGGPMAGGTANICQPNVWQTGQVPNNWIPQPIEWLIENRDWTKWAVVGNDYKWPRTMGGLATEVIEENGGEVVSNEFVPLGSTEFGAVVTSLQDLDDDVAIINTLVGADLIGFFKQWSAAGGENDQMITFALDEQTMEAIGPAAEGVLGAYGYFATLDTPENEEFVQKLEERFGGDAATPSSLSEQPYEAIWLWALAAEEAGSFDLEAIADGYPEVEFTGPRGTVRYEDNRHIALPLRIGVAGTDGLYDEFIAEFPPRDPQDQCDPSDYEIG